MPKDKLFTDFFPIQPDKLPKLYAYEMVGDDNANAVGGKLSYRLRNTLSGTWVWSNDKLISNMQKFEADLQETLSIIRKSAPDIFGHVHNLVPVENWQPSSNELADYVARGILSRLSHKIREILTGNQVDLGNAYVERDYEIKGWAIQGKPAISLSISSNLLYKGDLAAYARNIHNPDELIGTWVKVKTQDFKGEIVNTIGTLAEHKSRLLDISSDENIRKIIERAPSEESIVKIQTGQSTYDYVLSALNPILRMGDLHRFGVNSRKAMNAFRLSPDSRNRIVREVAKAIKSDGLAQYNSVDHPELFLTASDIGFVPKLRFGNNQDFDNDALMQNLHKYGVYRHCTHFENSPIAIGILDAREAGQKTTFAKNIKDELRKLNFEIQFVGNQHLSNLSRIEFQKAIDKLQLRNPDILIALLPGSPRVADDQDEQDEPVYRMFKSLTIGQDIQSQVIFESTLTNSYAVGNIVLGILGKTGNIPFVLADPLPYADLVVGIDVARRKKEKLPGSINSTAIARIYFNDGDFLRYKIHDSPIEGETVPDNVLKSLFPVTDFEKKRVVIHRDGFFRGNEQNSLKEWAKEIGAEFHLIEIIKSGAPRIYLETNGKIGQPPTSSIFKMSDREGLLVSSLPPFPNATPQPLRIRCDETISIEHALHSVLSLTLLHYGSVRRPRLPVTVHYSDKIGYLALEGIKPKTLEGPIPFWL